MAILTKKSHKSTSDKSAPSNTLNLSCLILLVTVLTFWLLSLSHISAFAVENPQQIESQVTVQNIQTDDEKHQSGDDTIASENLNSDSVSDDAAVAYSEQDLLDAQTNHSIVNIQDQNVPLSSFEINTFSSNNLASRGEGSIANTVVALVCAVSMIIIMISLVRSKQTNLTVITVRTFAIAIGLFTVATWSLFDKLSVPIFWFNDTSAAIFVLFVLYAATLVASFILEISIDKRAKPKSKESQVKAHVK